MKKVLESWKLRALEAVGDPDKEESLSENQWEFLNDYYRQKERAMFGEDDMYGITIEGENDGLKRTDE